MSETQHFSVTTIKIQATLTDISLGAAEQAENTKSDQLLHFYGSYEFSKLMPIYTSGRHGATFQCSVLLFCSLAQWARNLLAPSKFLLAPIQIVYLLAVIINNKN